jgi:heat shock protein HslJ
MFARIRLVALSLSLFLVLLTGCATTGLPLEEKGGWKLHTINDDLLYGDSEITLRFDSATQFSGFGGCNEYRGTCRYEAGAIDVLDVETTTDNRCDPVIRDQETRYLGILENAVNYHDQCDLLRLRSQEGDRMLFKRVVKRESGR